MQEKANNGQPETLSFLRSSASTNPDTEVYWMNMWPFHYIFCMIFDTDINVAMPLYFMRWKPPGGKTDRPKVCDA